MSYLLILELVTFVFVIAECLAVGHEKLQRQIYYLAFAWVVIWCTAKYAYGPDITHYIPFYEKLVNPRLDLSNPDLQFENGFIVFCSSLKYLGLSFWGMTAVISLLHFTAIGLLFRKIKTYKTMALFVLVCFSHELILIQIRQCLAVTFFIFFILLFNNKRHILALICCLITVTMHKSAIFIILCLLIFYALRKITVGMREYLILGALILLLLLLPLQNIIISIISTLPISQSLINTAEHHLSVGDSFQRIIVVYLGTVFCLAYYLRNTSKNKTLHWIMWCCVAVLVCLYPYYFLLNRLRPYFLPFLIVYIINTLQDTNIEDILPRQIYTVVVIAFLCITMIDIPYRNRQNKYPTDTISLVFERKNHSEQALINRQMKQAKLYWKYDYKRMLKLGKQND